MLDLLGADSLDALIDRVVPESIRLRTPLNLPPALDEHRAMEALRAVVSSNRLLASHLGQGFYGCDTPPVIRRNILENPGWYTQYTPYQAEISQGRLEALLNFQTMVTDLTGLEIANASLLDEPTAAAEAMAMCKRLHPSAGATRFFVSEGCHPLTLEVLGTRAEPLGIAIVSGDHRTFEPGPDFFGMLVQYPDTVGLVHDFSGVFEKARTAGVRTVVATDLLALALLRPPGEFGADVAIGNSQRFGVPMGFGGPHAAFFATRESFKRAMPGRVIGLSRDADGNPALRLAMQTREQHIRRDKATSNICTAQVLLAIMAGMFAAWHGPEGLRRIARRIHTLTQHLAAGLRAAGIPVADGIFFDTLHVTAPAPGSNALLENACAAGINLRRFDDTTVTVSLDETTQSIAPLLGLFGAAPVGVTPAGIPAPHHRTSAFLTHPVFHRFHTETEMMRYLKRLESRDLSLTTSMIPLGSCTMKLNAAAEMLPVTWPEISGLHPFVPADQSVGYREMIAQLESWLSEITGFAATSVQPNAGSQGEYAGLLTIRAWHASRGESHRDVCLIPLSAHGTNPASAVMAGFQVVPIACAPDGDIDLEDLKTKAAAHRDRLGAIMVTYPSTHGVFESGIRDICAIVHEYGGQVYMDGANMNAQVGLCRPGDFGADVCHLNLHKTFCIPHGGGGPGVGPVCVAAHLAPFLPGRGVVGPVSGAPHGSAGILVIPWIYIRLMGAEGLAQATKFAILNANYIARRLEPFFPVLYKGADGLVAHECIIDLRPFKDSAGIEAEDVSKRLMDYGFHAPTMSWPVAGTLMIEPTESECKAELDRFCDAMISIHGEIKAVAEGRFDRTDNPLKNAPHTAAAVVSDAWARPYSRETAAFPAPWTREHKFWPAVARVDNVYGDRNLVCSCPPIESFT